MMRVVPATPDLVPFLFGRMSSEDRAAACPSGNWSETTAAFENAIEQAVQAWCGLDEGGVVFLAAAIAVPGLPGVSVWCCHTAAVRLHLRECARAARAILKDAAQIHERVIVDVPAFLAPVRRLRRLGFVDGLPFDCDGEGTFISRCVRQAAPLAALS